MTRGYLTDIPKLSLKWRPVVEKHTRQVFEPPPGFAAERVRMRAAKRWQWYDRTDWYHRGRKRGCHALCPTWPGIPLEVFGCDERRRVLDQPQVVCNPTF